MASLTRYSNNEMLKLPDCEGLIENGKCKWLQITACVGANCSYYKNMNSLDRSQARLRSLDEETQEKIARKYYSGLRPWSMSTKSWR